MKYRPEIDGLRAVAVVPVLLFHAGFKAFSGGFVGVDIFFVISGYLITGIIAEEIRTGSFSLARFYERRARRILPALFTVCLACVPFAWMWMSPVQYKDFAQSLSAVTVFASNILFWEESGYFAMAGELKPLLHTWSLAVEEQFYVFFPLLLLALRRLTGKSLLVVLSALCAASLALSIYWSSVEPSGAFYLIPTRAWELGVGALLALWPVSAQRNSTLAACAASLGLVFIALAIASFDKTTPFPSYTALLPVAGAALLIRFAGEDWVGRLLRLRAVVQIGLISYSLYLWHQPIFAFLRLRKIHEPTHWDMAAAIALATVLAFLSWKFVETPFRRRDRMTRKTIFTTAALASAVVMSVGIAGHASNGFRDVNAARANAAAYEQKLDYNRGLSVDCEGGFQLSPNCRTDDDPELVVWGDSYAMHFVDGLIASSDAPKFIQFTMSVCGPALELAPVDRYYPPEWAERCLEFNRQVMQWIGEHPGVKYVVMSSPFDQYASGEWQLYTHEDGVRPLDWQFAAEKFSATMALLESRGLKVILLAPPPSYDSNIGRCLFKVTYLQLPADACDFPESSYHRVRDYRIKLLRAIDEQHEVLWLDEFICRGGTCSARWGDTFIYRDDGHLSREGAAELGRRIRLYDRLTGRFRASE